MEDFMKQFRSNLENRPEPPFEERNWQSLEKRLDHKDGKRRAVFAWWWLALPFALLLLTSNTLFFLESRQANEKIAAIEKQYSSFSAQHDTVWVKEVVYRIDTVYITSIVREYVPGYAIAGVPNSSANSLTNGGNIPPSNEVKVGGDSSENTTANTGATPSLASSLEDNSIDNQWVASNLENLEMLETPFLKNGKTKLHVKQIAMPLKEKKKTLRQQVYAMRPKGFRAAAIGGGNIAFSKGLNPMAGFSSGLEGVVEFSPKFSLWADAAFCKVNLSADSMGEDSGIPVIFPPNDLLLFEGAEVLQNSLQYSVGMQYTFNANGKWKPYIGVGIGAITQVNRLITYDFKNINNDPSWIFEDEIKRNILYGELLFLRAGIAHDFSKNWGWTLRGTYRHSYGNKGLQTPNILGVQTGLIYRFNKKR